jgi:hypothetical protein
MRVFDRCFGESAARTDGDDMAVTYSGARQETEGPKRSLVPARIDRLRWSRFHTRLVIALGVAWILDGLEITIASNATSLISSKSALNLSSASVAFSVGTVYLLGEVAGALFFGRLSDKWGSTRLSRDDGF